MNKVILIGNLGQDPELRYTQGGAAVLGLRIATSEKFKDRNGELQEKTEWHTVNVWGNSAEALNRYLKKGSKVAVDGSLTTRQWEDKEGNKRYSTEVKAFRVDMLDRKPQGGDSGGDDW